MDNKCWFLREWNGYWEVKWHSNENDKPQVGEQLTVENFCGGHHYHTVKEDDEFLYSTWDHVEYLYYSNNTKADYGWVDKEGRFYGCDWMGHSACAAAIFHISEHEAEQAGYVKIYRDPLLATYDDVHFTPDGRGWYCSRPLTDAQRSTLLEKGFKVKDDD
jgi:hypothetical protein